MLYLNQLDHPEIPYPTDLASEGSIMHGLSIREAGCGLCCLAMAADQLTFHCLSLETLTELSAQCKANLEPGTDMEILGPAVARLLDLDYRVTDSVEEAVSCLRDGGRAIANVGGDRPGYTGVFAHEGHYILLVSEAGGSVCILDPAYQSGRYDEPGRKGKVRTDGPFAYCSPELLARETDNRSPGFYLFSRKLPPGSSRI